MRYARRTGLVPEPRRPRTAAVPPSIQQPRPTRAVAARLPDAQRTTGGAAQRGRAGPLGHGRGGLPPPPVESATGVVGQLVVGPQSVGQHRPDRVQRANDGRPQGPTATGQHPRAARPRRRHPRQLVDAGSQDHAAARRATLPRAEPRPPRPHGPRHLRLQWRRCAARRHDHQDLGRVEQGAEQHPARGAEEPARRRRRGRQRCNGPAHAAQVQQSDRHDFAHQRLLHVGRRERRLCGFTR